MEYIFNKNSKIVHLLRICAPEESVQPHYGSKVKSSYRQYCLRRVACRWTRLDIPPQNSRLSNIISNFKFYNKLLPFVMLYCSIITNHYYSFRP